MGGQDDQSADSMGRRRSDNTEPSSLDLDETSLFGPLATAVTDGVVTADEDDRIVFANPAVESLLGWSPSEIVGRSIWSLLPDEWRCEDAGLFTRTLDVGADSVGVDSTVAVPLRHHDGHDVQTTVRVQEHAYEGERLVTLVITDVAETSADLVSRLEAEAALERERAVFDRLLETIPAGTMVTNSDGEITRINSRAERALGVSDSNPLGKRYTDLELHIHDEDGDPIPVDDHVVMRVFETGEPVVGAEFGLVGPDGSERWLSMNCAPVVAPDGTVQEAITVARDVTEQKQHERQLQAFRKAVEQAGHSVYLTDTDGILEYVNPAFEELTGYDATEAVGNPPSILTADEHDDAFYDDLWQTVLSGKVWHGEVTNRRKSGERYTVNQTIAPVVDEHGEIDRFVAVNADITEQKRREETLERHRNKLERIQQVTESLRPLNRELARASTREEVRRLVCEQLALSDAYQFAWYGELNPAVGRVIPADWAGVDSDFVDQFDVSGLTSESSWHPFAQAVHSQAVQAEQNVLGSHEESDRRGDALRWGYQSMAAVPIGYGGTVYGVVGVYTSRTAAFDENERALLGELGNRIGHAMNAIENKHLLYTDTVTELSFQSEDPDSVFNDLTDDLDCRLVIETITPARDDGYVCYVRVEGVDVAAVCDRLASGPAELCPRVVDDGDSAGLLECTIRTAPSATLLDYGATVRSVVVDEGQTTVVGEVAPEADVREIVAGMMGHAETTLVAKRTVDRQVSTLTATRETLDDLLTARQLEVLELAYHAGYFESPRLSTGDDLARVMGISSPTFYLHVRKATRRVLDSLLNERSLG
ncbi:MULTISPECIES: PAS domain S-box protein [Haloferax]|uniref:PAS domain S-box protein n=2 Tax=Haloferax TaxID=2251 RepID=A0A6G1Z6J9_9EURY|nr:MULTISPECIES: PAS domain S-box protein [Haloferax]KAB1185001.1 PAS domain S-box protein [Haloferax sp. CBA1149]MRW82176.1 PAS domain S-box protein [Haloferax marinisediminis]